MNRYWLIPLVPLGGCAGLTTLVADHPFWSTLRGLAFGWIRFLARVLPQVDVEWPNLALAAAVLAIFLAGFHGLCAWLQKHRNALSPDEPSIGWRFSWTAAFAGLIGLLFIAGMSVVGLVQHTTWMLESQEPLSAERYEGHALENPSRMRDVAMAALSNRWQHHDGVDTFAPGVSRDAAGGKLHSWQTLILPGFNLYLAGLDLNKPWDDPQNLELFRLPVRQYLNPAIRMPREQSPRLAPSHLSGNQFVLGPHPGLKLQEIRDGTSSTILLGQVAANFSPWAKPGNWRDPGLGINTSPDGFGAPGPGALMMMCDGSVRFFANETDKSVLKALSTPAGGEKTPELPPAR